uniref:Cyclin K protein n=1 Tax=Oikopleura dioica TaxID=34765 RepID=J7PUW7_OIKDI|nr:Cyclin K protein [Oikopleura dioica]
MPCWYWDRKDIENSPSRQQGLSAENEARYRKEGAKFIHKLGLELKLHHDTLATAAVFYHRFYIQHSFVKFRQRYVTATCCLFLAGKVEETPKKCKDLVRVAKQLLTEQHFASFGGSGPNAEITAREEVMAMERVVLQAIKFDFNVTHPYKYIIEYAEQLRNDIEGKTEAKQIESLVQQSWNFTNDSLQTTLCLQWEPEIVAISMIFLSAKLAKVDVLAASTKWWEKFIPDLSMELIESVCHSVLDIYQSSKKPKQKLFNKRKDATHTDGTPEKRLKSESVDQNMLKQLILQNVDAGKLSELVRAQAQAAENAALNQQSTETPNSRLSQPNHDHRPQPMSSVPTTPVQGHQQRPPLNMGQNLNPNQLYTPQPQRHQDFSNTWRPSTPQTMNQQHGGYGMPQGVQRPPMPNMHGGAQHPGYGGAPAQHGAWDNGRQSMNGTPTGPRGGRRGYGPSGNNFQQGGYQNQNQWR